MRARVCANLTTILDHGTDAGQPIALPTFAIAVYLQQR
jgi:hypothetical protein